MSRYLRFIGISPSRIEELRAATGDIVQPDQVGVFSNEIFFNNLNEDQARTIGWISNHLAGQGGDMFWTGKILDCKATREMAQ